jgi:hypothetical protein
VYSVRFQEHTSSWNRSYPEQLPYWQDLCSTKSSFSIPIHPMVHLLGSSQSISSPWTSF